LKNDIYHRLIYPDWRNDLIVAPKPQNLLLSERDNWFWNQGPEASASVKNATAGLQELIRRFGSYWLNDVNNLSQGLKGCINHYALE
jgi:hypothetical protein